MPASLSLKILGLQLFEVLDTYVLLFYRFYSFTSCRVLNLVYYTCWKTRMSSIRNYDSKNTIFKTANKGLVAGYLKHPGWDQLLKLQVGIQPVFAFKRNLLSRRHQYQTQKIVLKAHLFDEICKTCNVSVNNSSGTYNDSLPWTTANRIVSLPTWNHFEWRQNRD